MAAQFQTTQADAEEERIFLFGVEVLSHHWNVQELKVKLEYHEKRLVAIKQICEEFLEKHSDLDNYDSFCADYEAELHRMVAELQRIRGLRRTALYDIFAVGPIDQNDAKFAALYRTYLPQYTIVPDLPKWVLALQKSYDVNRDAYKWGQNECLGELYPKGKTFGRRFYDADGHLPVSLKFMTEYHLLNGPEADLRMEDLGWDRDIRKVCKLQADGRFLREGSWDVDRVLLAQGVDAEKKYELLKDEEFVDVKDSGPSTLEPSVARKIFALASAILVPAASVPAAPVPAAPVPAAPVPAALVPAPLPAAVPVPCNPSPAMPVGSTKAMVDAAKCLKHILKEHAYMDVSRAIICFNRAHYQPLPQVSRTFKANYPGKTSHWPSHRGNPPLGLAADLWDRCYNDAHSLLFNYAKKEIAANRIPFQNGQMTHSEICNRAARAGYLRDIAICVAIEKAWILHDFSTNNPTHTYDDSAYNVWNAFYN